MQDFNCCNSAVSFSLQLVFLSVVYDLYLYISGWEMRVDSHHRVFYIDHVNRTTTWEKPLNGQRTIHRRPTISSQQRREMDRRYQSIRRTIRQRPEPEPASNSAESSSSGKLLLSIYSPTGPIISFPLLLISNQFFKLLNVMEVHKNR